MFLVTATLHHFTTRLIDLFQNGVNLSINIGHKKLFLYTITIVFFILIVVPCILITLKFLSPTNANLYYTYKILKCTIKISRDCSYIFRSTRTIIREPMPNLAKVTILWRQSVKIRRHMFSNVVVKSVSNCGVYCVPCTAHNTHHSLKNFYHNTAEHITTYFY